MTASTAGSAAAAAAVPVVPTKLTTADIVGMWKVRWGIRRMGYTVTPGLYRTGAPKPDSPVIVTSNYRMTFDLVRRDLDGTDAWLLVLDTRGINVWCAAGKGTFSTRELVTRVLATGLGNLVAHRTLVLPQLGATGVSAPQVRDASGWKVVFGPVRSTDIRTFLDAGMKATPAMREVTFPTWARAVLAPIEFVGAFRGWRAAIPLGLAALATIGPGGLSLTRALTSPWPLGYLAGLVAGSFGTATLLPWLPGRAFALKGATVGAVAGALVGLATGAAPIPFAGGVLLAAAISSYVGMNFTGSSTFTSPSGVEKELRRYIPWQIAAAAASAVLWVLSLFGL